MYLPCVWDKDILSSDGILFTVVTKHLLSVYIPSILALHLTMNFSYNLSNSHNLKNYVN